VAEVKVGLKVPAVVDNAERVDTVEFKLEETTVALPLV
jgi:hypothetical protein